MKATFESDTIQVLQLDPGEEAKASVVQHFLQFEDARAKIAFSMIEKWGMMAALGDLLADREGHTRPERVPPAELVIRVCEVVDAGWNEMLHRGWIVKQPSIGD